MGKEAKVGEAERSVNGKKKEELRNQETKELLIGIIVRGGKTRDGYLMGCFGGAAVLGDDRMKGTAIVQVQAKVSEVGNSRN